jgi:glucokinase
LAAAGEQIGRCVERLQALAAARGETIAALGAACPGPFLAPEGRFLDPPNMPGWHGFALREFLAARVSCPVAAMNDANALALAEWRWGAGQGVRTLVYFTMSTGMGAGLVVDGRLYEGRRGFAGEIGHWRLDDEGPVGFGKRGSVEGFLSGPGIAQVAQAEARAALQAGEPTALLSGGAGLEAITAERVCEMAQRGDAAARRAVARCSERLGQLMALLVDLLEPELFVLGTIGSAWPELFIPGARAVLEREALAHSLAGLRIEPSRLVDRGNQSALAVALR